MKRSPRTDPPGQQDPKNDGAHHPLTKPNFSNRSFERAVRMLRAIADEGRLRLVETEQAGCLCWRSRGNDGRKDLDNLGTAQTASRRWGWSPSRREGKHRYYSVADRHIAELVSNSLSMRPKMNLQSTQVTMFESEAREQKETIKMSDHKTHDQHSHAHGSGCGHTAVKHEGHVDYLHDGHLHSAHQEHVDEHALTEGGSNPSTCTPTHACGEARRQALSWGCLRT